MKRKQVATSEGLSKKILSGDAEVRKKVLPALREFSRVVGATAGPSGRLVAIRRPGTSPHLTKDGVTVASAYGAEGFEGVAVDMVRQSAIETGSRAGDGTTTASVLAVALYEALGSEEGTNDQLVEELTRVEPEVLKGILDRTIKVETREQLYGVTFTSCNGDVSIAEPITEAFMELGPTGAVSVEEDRSRTDVAIQWILGSTLPSGFVSPYFVSEASTRVTLDNPYIWFSLTPLEKPGHVVPVMEAVAQANKMQGERRPLLVVCDKLSDEALSLLLVNNANSALPCCAINSPYLGNLRASAIRDLATVCGASPTARSGLTRENALETLGQAEKVIVEPKLTSFFEPKGDEEKVEALRASLEGRLATETVEAERAGLQKRLSNLRGKAAIIKVGGSTHSELVERKDRADDALASARWAMLEGICPGAGATLLKVVNSVQMSEALREAFYEPIKRVFDNYSGFVNSSEDEIFDVFVSALGATLTGRGFDIRSGEIKDDLIAAGVIDSSFALREAVRSAISAALALAKMRAIILDYEPVRQAGQ